MSLGSSGLNLGDVTFGLGAETTGLDASLSKLRTFGQFVDQIDQKTDKASKSIVNAYTRQEKAVHSLYTRVSEYSKAAQQMSIPVHQIAQGTSLLNAYTDKLTAGTLSARQFAIAQTVANQNLKALNDQLVRHKQVSAAIQNEMSRDFNRSIAGLTPKSTATKASTTALAQMLRDEELQSIASMQRMAQQRQAALSRMTQPTGMRASDTLFADMLRAEQAADRAAGKVAGVGNAFHLLQSSTVLATGPLSGIGYRITVLGSLMEQTSMKTALFIAGIVGATSAVGYLGAKAVQAVIQWETWTATMVSTTGGLSMVKEEMNYVVAVANKLGQGITGIIPSYTKFATSARLSGVSLQEQKNIFEAFMTAGAALQWNTIQTERAFYALTQMFAKGAIQSEELKLQLGEVLPGAMQIFARAIGVTQKEMMKLMQEGELLTSTYLPKVADYLKKVFDNAAQLGAMSTRSDINRFSTNTFMLAKAFDDVTHSSAAFHAVLSTVNSTLKFAAANMREIFGATAGILAFFVGFSGPAIVGGVIKLGAAIKTATVAMWALNAATLAGPWGAFAAILGRVALGLTAAYTGYNLMTRATSVQTSAVSEYVSQAAKEIALLQDLGTISKRESMQRIQATRDKIAATQAELVAVKALYDQLDRQIKKGPQYGSIAWTIKGAFRTLTGGEMDESKRAQAREEIKEAEKNLNYLQKQLAAIQGIKIEPDAALADAANKAASKIESARDQVRKFLEELKAAEQHNNAMRNGDYSQLTLIDSTRKVIEFLNKIDNAAQRNAIDNVLKQAGYSAGTLQQRLVSIVMATENFKESSEELKKVWDKSKADKEKLPTDRASVLDMFSAYRDRENATNAELQGEQVLEKYKLALTRQKELAEARKKIMTANDEMPTSEIGIYLDEMEASLGRIYEKEDKLLNIKALSQVDSFLAGHKSSVEAINEAYDKRIAVVNAANLTEVEASARITALENQRFKDLLADGTSYMGRMHSLLKNIASTTASTLANMFAGVGGSAKEMLRNITMQLLNMVTEMMIVKPLFEMLFGGLYSGKASAGSGLLGGFLSALGGSAGFGSGAAMNTAMGGLGTTAFSQQSLMLAGQVLHGGGTAGSGGSYRTVSAGMFDGAQKFHNGLKSGEVPAILQSGEQVVTQEQMKSLGGTTNIFHINVTAEKGATEREGQSIGRGIVRELEGYMNEWAAKQLRPGGILA